MKKLFLKITILVVLFLIPKMVFGNVAINEIAWMGTEISDSNEWIELYNNGDTSVDIGNWSIYGSDTGQCLNFSSADGNISTIIPASGYLIYANHTTDLGMGVVDIWDATIGLNNDSPGQLILYDMSNCTGSVIDTINQTTTWLAGKSATKQTMEKTATGWQTSLNPGGTPKAQNSSGAVEEPEPAIEQPAHSTTITNEPPVADAGDNIIGFVNQELTFDGTKSSDPNRDELHYEWNMGNGKLIEMPSFTYTYPYPGTYLITLMVFDGKKYASDTITVQIQQAQITINEFMANSENKDEKTGWIEVYNDADMIMDISNWRLDDSASGSAPFVFPKNTFIAPKSYLTFSQQITDIDLNNNKDSVRLLLPSGTVFQEINYENPLQNKSSARTAEGFVWSEPTPGIANISGLAIKNNKQTVLQMNSVKPQTVKNASEDYVVSLPKNEIEGGYVAISPNNQEANTQTNDLAAIKQSSAQNPLNLILLVIAVIFGSGFIGLLLIKFRKKRPVPSVVKGLPTQ